MLSIRAALDMIRMLCSSTPSLLLPPLSLTPFLHQVASTSAASPDEQRALGEVESQVQGLADKLAFAASRRAMAPTGSSAGAVPSGVSLPDAGNEPLPDCGGMEGGET